MSLRDILKPDEFFRPRLLNGATDKVNQIKEALWKNHASGSLEDPHQRGSFGGKRF